MSEKLNQPVPISERKLKYYKWRTSIFRILSFRYSSLIIEGILYTRTHEHIQYLGRKTKGQWTQAACINFFSTLPKVDQGGEPMRPLSSAASKFLRLPLLHFSVLRCRCKPTDHAPKNYQHLWKPFHLSTWPHSPPHQKTKWTVVQYVSRVFHRQKETLRELYAVARESTAPVTRNIKPPIWSTKIYVCFAEHLCF